MPPLVDDDLDDHHQVLLLSCCCGCGCCKTYRPTSRAKRVASACPKTTAGKPSENPKRAPARIEMGCVGSNGTASEMATAKVMTQGPPCCASVVNCVTAGDCNKAVGNKEDEEDSDDVTVEEDTTVGVVVAAVERIMSKDVMEARSTNNDDEDDSGRRYRDCRLWRCCCCCCRLRCDGIRNDRVFGEKEVVQRTEPSSALEKIIGE